ncbi:MAG: hypothetical protein CMG63_04490 [Candidatus Marinimicrobia bacterium]|nr:hypothetical protein [Candidatus Neomarinimicrobiota bacterium]
MKNAIIKKIKDDLNSGFKTKEFLEFATNSLHYIDRGFIKAGNHNFPYIIINKENSINGQHSNFLITPICFSGPIGFNLEELHIQINRTLKHYELMGGFIQTCFELNENNSFKYYQWGSAYIDFRTCYKIRLGNSLEDYIGKVKNDSKKRLKNILNEKKKYFLAEASSDKDIKIFAEMYSRNAKESKFSPQYCFTLPCWIELLKNNLFKLYLLHYKGKVVSGTIITKINSGFDYTFMAYDREKSDVSRANLLYIARYLNDSGKFLSLGGGIFEDDSLSKFKLSMGGEPYRYARYRFQIGLDNESNKHIIKKKLKSRWP